MKDKSHTTRTHTVPTAATTGMRQIINEKRLKQYGFRYTDDAGIKTFNILAAFGPDIFCPNDCDEAYMPRWLANLIPAIGEALPIDELYEFAIKLVDLAEQWQALDTNAWSRIEAAARIAPVAYASTEMMKIAARLKYTNDVEAINNQCLAIIAAFRDQKSQASNIKSIENMDQSLSSWPNGTSRNFTLVISSVILATKYAMHTDRRAIASAWNSAANVNIWVSSKPNIPAAEPKRLAWNEAQSALVKSIASEISIAEQGTSAKDCLQTQS